MTVLKTLRRLTTESTSHFIDKLKKQRGNTNGQSNMPAVSTAAEPSNVTSAKVYASGVTTESAKPGSASDRLQTNGLSTANAVIASVLIAGMEPKDFATLAMSDCAKPRNERKLPHDRCKH